MDYLALVYLGLIFFPNVISFALFGYDKHQATYQKWRIPEFVLLLFAFLNGAFGALCGMVFFKHKTKKNLFLFTVPILLFLQLAVAIVARLIISPFQTPLPL
ncbi:MAG: DUF1294 domain-containing protein [Prevotella sp.]|nr:DUF1294 domain-containing protein [Prevotella sp.]